MRKVYLLPNLFTTASLFAGVFAILNVFNVTDVAEGVEPNTARYTVSCWLILLSAVLDLLDGWVARMTRSESYFGAQYDSLADLVAFGVAPAILIYTRLSAMESQVTAEVIATLFVICGALRLARFNVQKSGAEKKSFTGLPIPAAAGTVVSGFLFFQQIDPEWDKEFVLKVLPVMMVGLSYLMVSKISYPSFKQLNLEERKAFEILPVMVMAMALVLALKNDREALVFFGFVGYVVWGFVVRLLKFRAERQQVPTGA
jgi:CDP-diacylglycerol---serine O-phosphatidyltransferase